MLEYGSEGILSIQTNLYHLNFKPYENYLVHTNEKWSKQKESYMTKSTKNYKKFYPLS